MKFSDLVQSSLKASGCSPMSFSCPAGAAAGGFKGGTGGCDASGGSGGTAAGPGKDSCSKVTNGGGGGTLSPATAFLISC